MSIDKIIANELNYSYVSRIEKPLNQLGLIFTDLKGYLKLEVVILVDETLLVRILSEMMPKYQDMQKVVYVVME